MTTVAIIDHVGDGYASLVFEDDEMELEFNLSALPKNIKVGDKLKFNITKITSRDDDDEEESYGGYKKTSRFDRY